MTETTLPNPPDETTAYEVVYKHYHYNTGSADNGTYTTTANFDSIAQAEGFANKIARRISEMNSENSNPLYEHFEQDLCNHNGYLVQLVGVFRTTRVQLDTCSADTHMTRRYP